MNKDSFRRKQRQFVNLNLMGLSDIAKELGWSYKKVAVYMGRDKFPEPIGKVGGRPVWLGEQMEPYIREMANERDEVEHGENRSRIDS